MLRMDICGTYKYHNKYLDCEEITIKLDIDNTGFSYEKIFYYDNEPIIQNITGAWKLDCINPYKNTYLLVLYNQFHGSTILSYDVSIIDSKIFLSDTLESYLLESETETKYFFEQDIIMDNCDSDYEDVVNRIEEMTL